MGQGFSYQCKNCGKKFDVLLGTGMRISYVYKKTIEDIRSGKYGEEWKTILDSKAYIATNVAKYLYKCENCGYWKVSPELSLYEPNVLLDILQTRIGTKNVKELGNVPCVTEYDLNTKYHLLRKYIHICPECGKRMKKSTMQSEFSALPCPICKTFCENDGLIMWD